MVTMEELREMDCTLLKRLLKRESAHGSRRSKHVGVGGTCLLLDCRPFLAHSAGFIQGSVNVRCNTIVRRRAKGSVSLEQILPAGCKEGEEEVLSRLRSGLYSAIIVYDERSPRADALREDSTVFLVVQALRRDTDSTDICLLKGIALPSLRYCVRPTCSSASGVALQLLFTVLFHILFYSSLCLSLFVYHKENCLLILIAVK
ncbi:dual specificity phosphatase 4 S homeolog [Xenopus laevis]|uniref:Dual specificity phosphatase 4 S homeolog n=1 Tax=Xenopus laevis TaxID=8355 RepID=Q3KQ32_XENLA|nr:dual specificity phosphatase 4 S homeolog [Xenopus laevis]AAI06408.1 MGC131045 protein [Xenopus laevis]